jgi:hypothetical protein
MLGLNNQSWRKFEDCAERMATSITVSGCHNVHPCERRQEEPRNRKEKVHLDGWEMPMTSSWEVGQWLEINDAQDFSIGKFLRRREDHETLKKFTLCLTFYDLIGNLSQ